MRLKGGCPLPVCGIRELWETCAGLAGWLWKRQNNEKRALERKLEEIKRTTEVYDSNTSNADAILDDMQARVARPIAYMIMRFVWHCCLGTY